VQVSQTGLLLSTLCFEFMSPRMSSTLQAVTQDQCIAKSNSEVGSCSVTQRKASNKV
jgi:hypothetical protein